MLDCLAIPQRGDPFLIPKPAQSYAELARQTPPRLRIGWSVAPLMGIEVDPEVAHAVEDIASLLDAMGHAVTRESPDFDGRAAMRSMIDIWFFGFDLRLQGYSARSGHAIGPDTLEPVVLKIYDYASRLKPPQFLGSLAAANVERRKLGAYFEKYDVWLCPTTSRVAEPWGRYNLGRMDVEVDELVDKLFAWSCQFTLPHNVAGIPAISLPLAMHSSGLPIGVQLAAGPASEHIVLQLAHALEEARPWADRVPAVSVRASAALG
jgi:amidase